MAVPRVIDHTDAMGRSATYFAARPSPFFVLGLPHVTLIELRLALISYQDYHMLLLTLAGHADLATVVHCALRELASYRAPKTNERALLLRPHQTLTDMHMRDRAELEFQKQCVEALFPVRLCLRSYHCIFQRACFQVFLLGFKRRR